MILGSGWLRCPENGKRAYVDEAAAERALDAIIRAFAAPGVKVSRYSYECPRCGWWHLSSRVAKRRVSRSA